MVRKVFTSTEGQVWIACKNDQVRRFTSITDMKDYFTEAYRGNHVTWEEVAGGDAAGGEIELAETSRGAQIAQLAGATFVSKLIRCDAATLEGKYHPRDWWYFTGWYAWREK